MDNWVPYPTRLEGRFVVLDSLNESHLPELEALAKDERIWEFYPYNLSDSKRFAAIYNNALAERAKGTQFPFVIFHKVNQKIIGSTRYLDMHPQHKKLEIGATWLHPDYWATAVNLECKQLLLTHCFETLKTIRVQLKTDENNWRSRKAIEKIGGQFEGILRNEQIRDNGTFRNSAFFSIIEQEWPAKKIALGALVENKMKTT